MRFNDLIIELKKSNLVLGARGVHESSANRASGAATLAGGALASVTLGSLALGHRLTHQLEGALLGDEAERAQVLDGLLASSVLLAANDASVMFHEVLLDEASRGVLSGSVENLGF